jgi:putative membrane protein
MPDSPPEPDYRFTLANERTFLAWIRTSLALIAGGVGLMQLVPSFGLVPGLHHGLSVMLAATGGVLPALAVQRWQKVQDAMYRRTELPPNRMPVALVVVLLVITGCLIALMIFEPHPG